MKKNRKSFMACLSLLALSSCATMSNLAPISGGAALGEANFEYVKTVSTSKTSRYLFHVIGGNNAAQQAVDELRVEAGLQSNQALTNIAVVRSDRYGIIFSTTTFTVSADIVEFK